MPSKIICFLLSLIGLLSSQSLAGEVTLFGPKEVTSSWVGFTTLESSFSAPKDSMPSTLLVRVGDGQMVTVPKCEGDWVERVRCGLATIPQVVGMILTRPQNLEVLVNGQVIINNKNYVKEQGSFVFPLTVKQTNTLKVRVQGFFSSSAVVHIKAVDEMPQPPPVAHFSATPEVGIAPQLVVLNGLLSRSQGGTISSYDWDFGDGGRGQGSLVSHTYSTPGNYLVKLTVTDNLQQKTSITKTLVINENQPPLAELKVRSSLKGEAPLMVWLDGSGSSDPRQLPLSYDWDLGDGTLIKNQTSITYQFKVAGTYRVRLQVKNTLGLTATQEVEIVATAPHVPQDPQLVAPNLPQGTLSSLQDSVSFLFTGMNPIQQGVQDKALDPRRIAVVSGKILSDSGGPLEGVTVRIHNRAEWGVTQTRSDGRYDMAVNGGGEVVVSYLRNGYLPVQRTVSVDPLNYAVAPTVVLTPRDSKVTPVVLDASASGLLVAQGSVVEDERGTRQATMVIPANSQAQLVKADGSKIAVKNISLRATEYTVGSQGPEKMPGLLPKTSAYMYAVDLSADEGTALGSEHLEFDRPVSVYVNNFLNFDPGFTVPVGTYNFQKSRWEPSHNGRVLKVLNNQQGLVQLDIDGSGHPATAVQLASLDLNAEELQVIGAQFKTGESFWRMRTTHFSPWDLNAPARSPVNWVQSTGIPAPVRIEAPQSGNMCAMGSIIDVNRQTLGEVLAVTGAPFELVYSSSRVPGNKAERSLKIPLLPAFVPSGILNVHLKVEVAGQSHEEDFVPTANLVKDFEWDGVDKFGRKVQGEAVVRVTIRYEFPQNYLNTGEVPFSFGRLLVNSSPSNVLASQPAVTEKVWETTLGQFDSSKIVGGWSISRHHFYDADTRTLFYGNGTKDSAARGVGRDNKYIVKFYSQLSEAGFAGDGGPVAKAQFNQPAGAFVAADDSLYVFDVGNARLRKITREGVVSTVAGNGIAGYGGDGGLAVDAQINPSMHSQMAQDNEGNIYFTDSQNHRIRKIDSQGIVSTVVGTGTPGVAADNTQALQARIENPEGLAFSEGTIYFSDSKNNLVRAVDPAGLIYTVLSPQNSVSSFVEPRALQMGPAKELYVMTQGLLYIVSAEGRVSIFGNQTFVGPTSSYYYGVLPFQGASHFVVQKDNRLFIAQSLEKRIWVSGGGLTKYLTGYTKSTEGVLPIDAALKEINGMAFDSNGTMYVIDEHQIKMIRSVLPPPSSDLEVKIASKNGEEIYVFAKDGRHLKTLSAKTGVVLEAFEYSAENLLVKITDAHGLVTQLTRNAQGDVERIQAPYGYTTELAYDSEGFLASVQNPLGHQHRLEYASGGLLTKFIKPSGAASRFTYNAQGLLLTDTNAAGGFTELLRSVNAATSSVSAQGALSASRRATVSKTTLGDERTENVSSNNLITTHITFDNYKVSQTPFVTISETERIDPYFGGLAYYTATRLDPVGGSTTADVDYERIGAGEFDYIKTVDFTPPNLGYFKSEYNAKTRVEKVTSPAGGVTEMSFDLLGRPVKVEKANLAPMTWSYTSEGQVQQVAQGSRVTQFNYTQGNLTSVRSPAGLTTQFEYDGARRLVSETRPDGRMIKYEYDVNGNRTSITPPGRPKHVFGFDVLDLMTSYLPPLLGGVEQRTQYTYDLENKLKEVRRPDGRKIVYTYDGGGRLIRIGTEEGDYLFTYNAVTGLVESYKSPQGVQTTLNGSLNSYIYNVTGALSLSYRIIQARFGSSFVDRYYYIMDPSNYAVWDVDLLGNKASEGSYLRNTRNPENNLLEKTESFYVRDSNLYNTHGEIVNSKAELYAIDDRNLLEFAYQRDALGRIQQSTVTDQGVTHQWSYEYDHLGRVVKVTRDGVLWEKYTYDDNGNRTESQIQGVTKSFTYDAQDRLLTAGGKAYSYSPNGELISVSGEGASKSYSYNSFGYLTRAQVGSQVVDYLLDAKNNRMGKKVNGVLKQSLVYSDRDQIIGELNHDLSEVRVFVYGSRDHSPDAMKVGNEQYYFIRDNIGSVRMVVNIQTGAIMQELEYDTFGRVLRDTNPGFQPFGFAGGLYDRETGLVRFGARDYDAETGRWTSKDPIGFAGGDTNLYGYVAHDPINHIDPSGKICFAVRGITKIGELFLLAEEKKRLVNEYNSIAENSCPSSAQESRKNAISERVNQIDNIFNNRSTLHGFIGDVLDSCNNTGIYGPSNPQVDGI